MISLRNLRRIRSAAGAGEERDEGASPQHSSTPIGIIAGNGPFPLLFAKEAARHGRRVHAVCHRDETLPEIESIVEAAEWIRVGELGRLIQSFRRWDVREVAMAGGINRVKHFKDIKLDARGAAMMLKLRSTKDDVIMRGIAAELEREGITVIPCTTFLQDCVVRERIYSKSKPTADDMNDIQVGIEAIRAMRGQHIGQLVVVRKGVIVAVEAVEGSNAAIRRGGELGGAGSVVVKCAKPDQDMRFDVPTVGPTTIEVMQESGCSVLALEAGRSLIIEEERMLSLANLHKIAVIGCPPLEPDGTLV